MLINVWNWLTSNSAALGVILAAAPILWAVIEFILIKKAEAKRFNFEAYHRLIKQLVEPEGSGQSIKLDRQVAIVFELRHFKRYYPVTRRILCGLKSDWSSGKCGSPDNLKRLLEEIDLTIEHISKKA
jgi:hypothetical protein